jgi:Zn-dependent M28 family amino/carboxypeptidase
MFKKIALALAAVTISLFSIVVYVVSNDSFNDIEILSNTPGISCQFTIDTKIKQAIRLYVDELSDDKYRGRLVGSDESRLASEYIASKFSKVLKKYDDDYFQDFEFVTNKFILSDKSGNVRHKARNVVGYHIVNQSSDYIVIGGHYDHIGSYDGSYHYGRNKYGDIEIKDDLIFNGADDNASGISVMLGVIDNINLIKSKYNIIFIAFDGEEEGLYGSAYYVSTLDKKYNILAMINLDMVGRCNMSTFISDKCLHVFGKLFRDVTKVLSSHSGLHNNILVSPELDGDSDHSSFRDAGIPYMFFFSGLHKEYHTVYDEVVTKSGNKLIDYDSMAALVHTILHIVEQK